MIDFACVSSTTPTWSNDPRWCTPGTAATEAEHGKLAADRASSALVQGVHRYYTFVGEDRGRHGKFALTVVYIFAVLRDANSKWNRVGTSSIASHSPTLTRALVESVNQQVSPVLPSLGRADTQARSVAQNSSRINLCT
eukprot:jgi/Tetstr1/443417/TSEL_031428.t1